MNEYKNARRGDSGGWSCCASVSTRTRRVVSGTCACADEPTPSVIMNAAPNGSRIRRRSTWRECMGIEPTQPDEVRSRTVLKTVRATRLHPLPTASRKQETACLFREDFTDLD